jgi:PTH1 family peptidyl-tRNA hydrolase
VPSAFKLIVGLGNPGPEHSETRHNAGFWFVDSLAAKYSLSFRSESKFNAEICRMQTAEIDCWLCKPMMFMNRSGFSVQAMASFYKIPVEGILIAHDELDLDPGVARLKKAGGHGGHNGLRDIIAQMGDKSFTRLRLGIGHPGSQDKVTSYVLGRPAQEDRQLIEIAIKEAVDVIPLVLEGNEQKAMNALHQNNNINQE